MATDTNYREAHADDDKVSQPQRARAVGFPGPLCSRFKREEPICDHPSGVGAQSGRLRGSPKRGRTLLSKRAIAQTRPPDRVNTRSPNECVMAPCGSRTYMPKAGWPLARV